MKKIVAFAVGAACLGACNIYPNWSGEFYAGPVDPVAFPPPYLGSGGANNRAGTGSFTEISAHSDDTKIGYYAFPFSTTVLASFTANPLQLESNNVPVSAMPTIQTYVFDASSPGSDAFPTSPQCEVPGGYVYNQTTQAFDLSQQYPVFDALPTATYLSTAGKAATWSYEPISAELSVSGVGSPCQGYKSEATIIGGDTDNVKPDGRYLAWPVIDPGAAVYRVGQTSANSNGLTAQRFGWYNHYLVAYFDGGYIPTATSNDKNGVPQVLMVAQNLYYPSSKIITKAGGTAAAGQIGQGYDVLDTTRGAQDYSPICAVHTYNAGLDASGNPPTLSELPTNSADILTLYGTTVAAANPPYIYCLQVP